MSHHGPHLTNPSDPLGVISARGKRACFRLRAGREIRRPLSVLRVQNLEHCCSDKRSLTPFKGHLLKARLPPSPVKPRSVPRGASDQETQWLADPLRDARC